MASDPSADLSSPSVGSPYDSLRIRIPKSESPPGLDLQTDASSAHDFILQFTFQKIKSSKNKNSIYGVNCTLQIIHIVLLYGTEDLFFLRKYDTIAHFFHKVLFDFLRPRFSIFWGKIHALMEGNSRIRLPDRRIQQLHVKINQARIFSVSPSKVAALRGDPSTHSSSFLAKIISHRLLSTAQDDGSGKNRKAFPAWGRWRS